MYWRAYFAQYFPVIVVVVDIVCHIDNGVDCVGEPPMVKIHIEQRSVGDGIGLQFGPAIP